MAAREQLFMRRQVARKLNFVSSTMGGPCRGSPDLQDKFRTLEQKGLFDLCHARTTDRRRTVRTGQAEKAGLTQRAFVPSACGM